MIRLVLIGKLIILVIALLLIGLQCGEDDPVSPENIESGSDDLETLDGSAMDYYFSTSLGQIKGFSLYVNQTENTELFADSGLIEEEGDIAPDPSIDPKGRYPDTNQPHVGEQLYLFMDHGGSTDTPSA